MNKLSLRSVLAFSLPALLAVVGSAGIARADVLPPDTCAVEDLGQPCTNAGSNGDEDGTCQISTCTSLNYQCDGGSSGPCGSTQTSCSLCLPGSGSGSGSESKSSGSSSKSSESGSKTSESGSGSEESNASSTASSSGCSASPSTSGATDGLLFFGLGGALVMASRRRRTNG